MKDKVVVKGAFGEGNFGDDALLVTLLRWLQLSFDSADIAISTNGSDLSYLNKLDESFKGIATLKYNNFLFHKSNLVIYGGGTQFFSFKGKSAGLSVYRKIFKLSVMKRIIYKVINTGRQNKEIFFGIGIGPFANDMDFNSFKRNVSGKKVLIRDSSSKRYLSLMGIESEVYSDLCFIQSHSHEGRLSGASKKVAIILRDWRFETNGLLDDQLINICLEKKREDFDFSFVFFGKDILLKSKLDKLNIKYTSWDPDKDLYSDFISALSVYDAIVSSRYHGIIFGVQLSIPSIGIAIEPKIITASHDFESVKLLDNNNINDFYEVITDACSQENKKNLQKDLDKMKKRSEKMFLELKKEIDSVIS